MLHVFVGAEWFPTRLNYMSYMAGVLYEAGTACKYPSRAPVSPLFFRVFISFVFCILFLFFCFLYFVFVLFLFVLCLVYPMLPISLDSTFFVLRFSLTSIYLAVFYVLLCQPLIVCLSFYSVWTIVLFVVRHFSASDNHYGIFKLFSLSLNNL